MKKTLLYLTLISGVSLLLLFTDATAQSGGATLSVALAQNADTTGMDAAEVQQLERTVKLALSFTGASSDTLVVELGMEVGSYDLLTRRFPLNTTGQFDDGCSLTLTGSGMTVGLGNYTGLSDFYVRAYLSGAGVGSAVMAP